MFSCNHISRVHVAFYAKRNGVSIIYTNTDKCCSTCNYRTLHYYLLAKLFVGLSGLFNSHQHSAKNIPTPKRSGLAYTVAVHGSGNERDRNLWISNDLSRFSSDDGAKRELYVNVN